jgi:hypothetical protein
LDIRKIWNAAPAFGFVRRDRTANRSSLFIHSVDGVSAPLNSFQTATDRPGGPVWP